MSVSSPLVSCIMPTQDRPEWARAAIAQFHSQDWEARELIILDGSAEPLPPAWYEGNERIRYERVSDGAMTLGERRNRACELARGELIAHWDDDDWMAPWRLRYQVTALVESGRDLSGITSAHFIDEERRTAYRYDYPDEWQRARPWLLGGSLVYRRETWARLRFPSLQRGEDDTFVGGLPGDRLEALPDIRFYVARIHARNTATKNTTDIRFTPVPIEDVEAMMRDASAGGERDGA